MTTAPPASPAAPAAPRRRTAWHYADVLMLLAMAAGLGLMLQPWWGGGLRSGFFVTLAGTLGHIVTSHKVTPREP